MSTIIRSLKDSHIYYEFDKFQPPVGEGGMGKVYKGQLVNEYTGFSTTVAIKEILIEGDSASRLAAVNRAREEASIMIKHDNVMEMIEFLEVGDTRFGGKRFKYYIVSEFLNCVSLADLLAGKCENYAGQTISYARQLYEKYRQSPEEVSSMIIRNVISGITAIHDFGYLHRDIDPSNVMVTDDGKIKLIDFGIAKRIDELRAGGKSVLEMGSFIGKVEYAAPELLDGKLQLQCRSTDIYSIGVLFYSLLTGHLPFTGTSFDIIRGHQHKKPRLGEIRNKKYRAVVGKAMSKTPESRFPTASSMRAALESNEYSSTSSLPVNLIAKLCLAAVSVIAVIVIVVQAVNYFKDKKSQNPPIGTETPTHYTDTSKIKEDTHEVIDVGKYSSMDVETLWAELKDNPDNPALLFYISVRTNGTNLKNNRDAIDYYQNVLIPEGLAERYLQEGSSTEFSSQRFAFLIGCRAYEKASGKYFSDSSFPDTMRHHLETIAGSSKYFILNYE